MWPKISNNIYNSTSATLYSSNSIGIGEEVPVT